MTPDNQIPPINGSPDEELKARATQALQEFLRALAGNMQLGTMQFDPADVLANQRVLILRFETLLTTLARIFDEPGGEPGAFVHRFRMLYAENLKSAAAALNQGRIARAVTNSVKGN